MNKGRPRIWIALLFGATVALGAIGSLRPNLVNDNYWLFTVIVGLITSALASFLVILFGYERLLAELRAHEVKFSLGEVIKFWKFVDTPPKAISIIYGGTLGSFLDDQVQNTSLATIFSIHQLQDVLKTIYGPAFEMPYRSFDRNPGISDINSHVILLGGHLSIPSLHDFPIHAGLPCSQDFRDLNNRKIVLGSQQNPSQIFASEITSGHVVTDYTIITIVTEMTSRKTLVWVSGNYGIGTYGGILYLTQSRLIQPTLFPAPGKFVQLVLRVGAVEDSEIDVDHPDITLLTTQSGDLPPKFSLSLMRVDRGAVSEPKPRA